MFFFTLFYSPNTFYLGFPIDITLRGNVRKCKELHGIARNCAELRGVYSWLAIARK